MSAAPRRPIEGSRPNDESRTARQIAWSSPRALRDSRRGIVRMFTHKWLLAAFIAASLATTSAHADNSGRTTYFTFNRRGGAAGRRVGRPASTSSSCRCRIAPQPRPRAEPRSTHRLPNGLHVVVQRPGSRRSGAPADLPRIAGRPLRRRSRPGFRSTTTTAGSSSTGDAPSTNHTAVTSPKTAGGSPAVFF